MNRVLDRLFIGSSQDLDGSVPFSTLGFTAVLDLRDGDSPSVSGVKVLRLKNKDGEPWGPEQVEKAMQFIDEHIRHGKVLVACVAGISRSASMVIGHLVKNGWDLPTAYTHVKKARAEIAPIASMLHSVLRFVVGV